MEGAALASAGMQNLVDLDAAIKREYTSSGSGEDRRTAAENRVAAIAASLENVTNEENLRQRFGPEATFESVAEQLATEDRSSNFSFQEIVGSTLASANIQAAREQEENRTRSINMDANMTRMADTLDSVVHTGTETSLLRVWVMGDGATITA
jgi:hypothetical protein